MDFVAIDFETANSNRESACAIGLVKVVGGVAVDSYYSLLRPPKPFDYFDARNVFVHGIREVDVKAERTLGQAWQEIEAFLGDLPLVAHNAGFDMSVLRKQLGHEGVGFKERPFLCTLVLARRISGLSINTLPYVAQRYGVALEDHHEAEADALAAAEILLQMQKEHGELSGLLESAQVKWGLLSEGSYRGSTRKRSNVTRFSVHYGEEDLLQMRAELGLGSFDEESPLYGAIVSFSGTLSALSRERARLAVQIEGGDWVDKPNKKTNFFVIGEVDLSKLRPGEELSAKVKKAQNLHADGYPIEIMDEQAFLEMLSFGPDRVP
jgi:DNA polymerase-3 subunit epsilon